MLNSASSLRVSHICLITLVSFSESGVWGNTELLRAKELYHPQGQMLTPYSVPTDNGASQFLCGKNDRIWKFFRVLGGVYSVICFPPLLSFVIFIIQLLLGVFLFQWWRWDNGINRKAPAFSKRGVQFLKQNGCSLKSSYNIFWTFTSSLPQLLQDLPLLLTQPTCCSLLS